MKKRRRVGERELIVPVRSLVEGKFKSRLVRWGPIAARDAGGAWMRLRAASGLIWGAVKRILESELRSAMLRLVIARVQAESHVKDDVWRVRMNFKRSSSALSCSLRRVICCKEVEAARTRRRRDWSWFLRVILVCSRYRWLWIRNRVGSLVSSSRII